MSEHLEEIQHALPEGYRCRYESYAGKYVVTRFGRTVLTRTVEEVRRWKEPKAKVMASAIRFEERRKKR